MFLPDVNLWLALAFESHVHHEVARDWLEGLSSDRCAFVRMTQQGFLRLATNPKAFGAEAVTMSDAWRMYDASLADSRITFSGEPVGVKPLCRGNTQRLTFSPKVWSDAFQAALARAAGFELITFDKGFAHYTDLKCTILG